MTALGRRRAARGTRGRSTGRELRRRPAAVHARRRGAAASCAGPTRRSRPRTAEAAIVLRRACDIGMGRGMDLDGDRRSPTSSPEIMAGICYTMQPERHAGRVPQRGLDPRLRRPPRRRCSLDATAPTWTCEPHAVSAGSRPTRVGEAAQAVDRLGRAAPRRDDQAGDAEVLPARARRRGDVDRAAEADLERLVGVAARTRVEQRAQPRDLRRRRLERVRHADPAVAEAGGAAQRGVALAADEDRRPRLLHRLRLEHDLVEVEELAVVRRPSASVHSRLQTSIASSTRRPRVAKSSRPRPTPPRASSRRCRTRSGRRETMSSVCTPRAATNGWRSPMLYTWVPSRMRSVRAGEEREVRERVEDRRGRAGPAGASSPGCGERLIVRREHEVLGQPHRLVAEPLGRERRVDVEVRVERAERDAELHGPRRRRRAVT